MDILRYFALQATTLQCIINGQFDFIMVFAKPQELTYPDDPWAISTRKTLSMVPSYRYIQANSIVTKI